MQERQSPNVSRIIAKIREEETNRSKISIKKGTLINKLKEIELNVKTNLGNYHPILLDSNEKWIEYCNNIGENDIVSIDTETSGLSFKDQTEGLAGVCIKSIGQTEAYAPVGHISSITEQPLSNQVSKEGIKQGFDIMNKKHCRYVFHNAYYDLIVLKAVLGYFPSVYWDTLVAAAMLNENEPHSLKVLYDKYVMEGKAGVHKFVELFDGIPFNRINPKVGYYYSAHDCLMTEQLYLFQKPYLTVGTEECKVCHLEGVSKVFYTEEKISWKNKLIFCAYIKYSIDKNDEARKIYDIASDNDAFEQLLTDILKRSIYEYLVLIKYNKDLNTEIFTDKNISDKITYIETNWVKSDV